MATYWRGFADGISDWTQVAVASGQTNPAWSVVNTDQLQATSASSHNEALVWDDIDADADRDDFEVLCQIYVGSTSATQRWLGGRISTSGASRNGYALRVRTASIDTYRFNGATFTQITAGTFSVASGTWVWVRFRVNGSTIRARAWADGDAEPGTWQCDGTDSTYSTLGHVGALKAGNTNTQLWRYFGVGTNGDTAPASGGSALLDIAGTATASLSGTLAATGDLQFTVPFDVAGSAAASLSGALSITGDLEFTEAPSLDLSAGAAALLSGTLAVSGDVQFTLPVDIAATAEASLSGALSITGDLEYSTDIFLDIAAEPIALSGTFSAAGDLDPYPSLSLEGAQSAALAGALAITGDLQSVVPFDIGASAAAALSGVLGVAGDLQFSTEPIDEPAGGDGENYGPIGRGSIVHRITARRGLVAASVRPIIGEPLQPPATPDPIVVPGIVAARALRAAPVQPRGMLLRRTTAPPAPRANFCANCGAPLPH